MRKAHIKVIQYADDTTFFLDGTEKSLRAVFGELGWYAKYSGLKPNVSKSHAMWIGSAAFSGDKICPDIDLNWEMKIKLLGIIFRPRCESIVEENVKVKKEAMMRTIGMWQNRHLTLIGRITITKALLLSQLTHVLSSLPSPNEITIKEINQMLFSFIWGSKRNPLRRLRLCQSMKDNGLEMIDLKSYLTSLKMKWIKRFLTEKNRTWHMLAPTILQKKFIWNFGVTSLKKISLELHNPFWKDMVFAWLSFSKAFNIPDELIQNESLFNSEYTKFKSSSHSSWERRGLQCIGDLFEGNKLMTWKRLKEVYAMPCNYLEYIGLVHSLPKQMQKDQPDGWYQERPVISARLNFLLNNRTFSRFFAKSLIESNQKSSSDLERIKTKWIRDIKSFEPRSVLFVKRSVTAIKYVSFQYRLVMRILTTNTFLFLIGRSENDRCTFCADAPETLEHLFLTCRHAKKYWRDIISYLLKHHIDQPTEHQKMFGKENSSIINHIVTLAKYIIYDSRRNEARPNFAHFETCLKFDFETERHIAIKNGNMECFNKKWSMFKNFR